jgi:hypothetical protein
MIYREAYFRDLPQERRLYDYGVRTDGQPVYRGNAKLNTPTSDPAWTITYAVYDDDGNTTEEYCLKGAWDQRTALFLEYV